jgi:hypothetical protein
VIEMRLVGVIPTHRDGGRSTGSRHPRLLGGTVVLIAAIASLAGCGSAGDHRATPTYVKEVNAVASRLDSVTNNLFTPTDTSSAAAELITVRAALRKAANGLEAITPPRPIARDHERLVAALDELASGVTPLIAKLKSGDLQGIDRAFSLKGAREAKAAIAAINEAGYRIQIPLLS